jgi:hypothetical protein
MPISAEKPSEYFRPDIPSSAESTESVAVYLAGAEDGMAADGVPFFPDPQDTNSSAIIRIAGMIEVIFLFVFLFNMTNSSFHFYTI